MVRALEKSEAREENGLGTEAGSLPVAPAGGGGCEYGGVMGRLRWRGGV